MLPRGLDLIILDDEALISRQLAELAQVFYDQGQVRAFSDALEAKTFCFQRESSIAIFVLDVFLGPGTAFDFLDAIAIHYPAAAEDAVIITGQADDAVVEQCRARGVHHLLEKPIKPYAFQFAIRAIADKYLKFAKRLMTDPHLAADVHRLG